MTVPAVNVVEDILAVVGPQENGSARRQRAAAPAVARITHRVAAKITPGKPEWLWPGWLVLRALNLLTGRQGTGKTTFIDYVIALLTLGVPLPGDTARDPITCAILSLEEPPDRVVARLTAAGADLDRVHILGDVEDHDGKGNDLRRRWSLPGDVSILGSLIKELGIQLVVVDGLGYSISGDSHNYAVVGSALSALAGEADRSGAAILGLVHPPKGASDPVTSAIGSTAWTAIPRISMVLGLDPNDENGETRIVRVAKSNYKMPASGLSFCIAGDDEYECGYVTQLRADDTPAEDIMGLAPSSEEKGERAEAREVLLALLADGPMDAAEVLEASGISERTLRRARKDLGVTAEARRNQLGRVLGWTWSAPEVQKAKSTRPSNPWPSGPSGHTQDIYPSSLPDGQGEKAGRLDSKTTPSPLNDDDFERLFAAEDEEVLS